MAGWIPAAVMPALDGREPLRSLSRPTHGPHRLHGPGADEWSVRVSHGWRVTFRMDGPDVRAVRHEEYHHEGVHMTELPARQDAAMRRDPPHIPDGPSQMAASALKRLGTAASGR